MIIRVSKSLSLKIKRPEYNARRSIAGIHQRSIHVRNKKHWRWHLNLRQITGGSHNVNEQDEHVFRKSSCNCAMPEIKHEDATGKLVCSALTSHYHYCVVCFVLTTVTVTHLLSWNCSLLRSRRKFKRHRKDVIEKVESWKLLFHVDRSCPYKARNDKK